LRGRGISELCIQKEEKACIELEGIKRWHEARCDRDQPGLYCEFQANLGYIAKTCLSQNSKQQTNKQKTA
jgi:hypothetical protein